MLCAVLVKLSPTASRSAQLLDSFFKLFKPKITAVFDRRDMLLCLQYEQYYHFPLRTAWLFFGPFHILRKKG